MTPDSREEKNALAFLDHLVKDCGHQLRPPGYYTLNLVQLLGLRFGKANGEVPEPEAAADDVSAYLFIQAAPVPTVARAVRTYRRKLREKSREEAFEDFLCDAVAPFIASLAPDVKAELEEQLGQMDEVDAARVIADPPERHKPERPDPK